MLRRGGCEIGHDLVEKEGCRVGISLRFGVVIFVYGRDKKWSKTRTGTAGGQ